MDLKIIESEIRASAAENPTGAVNCPAEYLVQIFDAKDEKVCKFTDLSIDVNKRLGSVMQSVDLLDKKHVLTSLVLVILYHASMQMSEALLLRCRDLDFGPGMGNLSHADDYYAIKFRVAQLRLRRCMRFLLGKLHVGSSFVQADSSSAVIAIEVARKQVKKSAYTQAVKAEIRTDLRKLLSVS